MAGVYDTGPTAVYYEYMAYYDQLQPEDFGDKLTLIPS